MLEITTIITRGISGQTILGGAAVLVGSNGRLGTMTSSERFNEHLTDGQSWRSYFSLSLPV
jgi:hypothetical protein